MSRRFLEIWLTTVGLLFAAFGIVMAALSETQTFRLIFDSIIEHAYWPGSLPAEVERFRAWVYGAWGGTVTGFGLLLATIAKPAISGDNQHVRLGALAAITVWFLIDTAASIFHVAWGQHGLRKRAGVSRTWIAVAARRKSASQRSSRIV